MGNINQPIAVAVAVLGATGMVGQRFIQLLNQHPWFQVKVVAASPQSAGKTYAEAVAGRWTHNTQIPPAIASLRVHSVEQDLSTICQQVRVAFCALDLEKDQIRRLEEAYAAAGVAVISNNSAHRWTKDVPMLLPEVNPEHCSLIEIQRKQRGWSSGLIAVKPNCSIQSYVPVLHALKHFEPEQVVVTTLQAISGAGKTFQQWPEMLDNVIPFIGGEEQKSEQEPMRIWGQINADGIEPATCPKISATCIRVPVTDGHMASIAVKFRKEVTQPQLIEAITSFQTPISELRLPSAPTPFLNYFSDENRPQTKSERDLGQGMAISVGRIRPDPVFGWKMVALSHNTIRGAAGGAVLMAELLRAKGYF